MTLTNFKVAVKYSALITIILLYGAVSFLLGKTFSVKNFIQFKNKPNEITKPIETSMPYADAQSGKVISSFAKLCSNTVFSFQLAYPKNWFTTFNSEPQKCLYFAPYSFVIPSNIDSPFVPINIEIIKDEDWLQTSKFYQNPNEFQNVISVENIQTNNKSAQKILAQTTGAGFLPSGFTIVRYLINASPASLVLSYQQLNDNEDIKMYEDSLFEMVNTLDYF